MFWMDPSRELPQLRMEETSPAPIIGRCR
jgi:hypothetical protein